MATADRTFWFVGLGAILGLAFVVGAAHALAYVHQEWPYSHANLPPEFEGPSKQNPLVPGTAFWYAQRIGIFIGLVLGGLAGWFVSRC